ncbi:TonB-dependent receptor [Sphingobacteriaceae bacterium]|nr:TonB-dependent receptor [Sphingobacteriaceae bacterium]
MRHFFLWTLVLCSSLGFAQTPAKYTISGYINEKGSRENLPGATVYVPKLKVGAASNSYGFYSITLPADTIEVLISYVGYKAQAFKIQLNKNIQLDIEMQSNSLLEEVEITAKSEESISEDVQMSKIDLPVEQIKSLPALLGEKDVLKAIQLLPGVQKGSEGSSGIYVRGGGPDQNLIILDDATVYNASHLFGFFSLFNGDALKSVELTKGGFPSRYGGRLSSVIDMQMKDGNKEKIKADVGIGLISSRLTLEGPLKKNKASFLISGRRTYIDFLARPLIKKYSEGVIAGYYFYDLNAKLNYNINYRNKIYLSGYFGKDKFYLRDDQSDATYTQKTEAGLQWGNATATLRWNHLFTDKLFSNISLICSDYKLGVKFKETDDFGSFDLKYNSGIRDYSVKGDLDFFPSANHKIKTGLVATFHHFTPNAVVYKESSEPASSKKTVIDATEAAIYVEDDYKITQKWRINAGIRLTNFNVRKKSYINPEPRLSVRYAINKTLSVKASYATMNQYLHLLSNSGYSLPTDLWVPATDRVKPQQSKQVALGLAKDLKIKEMDFLVSLEGYYKSSKNVIGYKEGASFINIDDINPYTTRKYTYEDAVTSGKAESYGAEFFLQKKAGKFTGWVGYTLSWTWLTFDELNFGKRFPARYDRRHDISVVGIYKLSKKISFSAVWVYGTGNAITLPLSTYQLKDHSSQYSQTIVSQQALSHGYPVTYNDNPIVNDYGERNSFRMASYHRLDVAVQFHKIRKKYERIFELGLYNAYNRKNPFFYTTQVDRKTNETKLIQISLFPIIPSISWTWKF